MALIVSSCIIDWYQGNYSGNIFPVMSITEEQANIMQKMLKDSTLIRRDSVKPPKVGWISRLFGKVN